MGKTMAMLVVALTMVGGGSFAQTGTTISGRISHPDGTPAPDTPVFAATVASNGGLRTVARAVAEWDGQYQLSGLLPGRYVIGARRTAQSAPTYYPSTDDIGRRQPITVFESVPAEGIDIWLQPLPQRYSVSGRIYWPEGRSISNLAVEYGGPSNPRMGIWYVFDPGGLFSIDGAPPGLTVLLVRADSEGGPLVGMASTDVSVAPVEDVKVVLGPTGSVEGRLVFERPPPAGHATSRVVLVHSLLRVSPLYPVESAAVGGDGGFRVASARGVYGVRVDGLPAGWSVKRMRRAGRPITAGRLTVGPGEAVTAVELVVGPAAK